MSGSDRTRILVAEDDTDFLVALKHWLSDYGNSEVLSVTNGKDAVESLDSTVDLFLCDQRMPKLTAPEILAQLEQEDYEIPTIVISAYELGANLTEDDIDLYLSKPITRKELLDAIDRVLET